MLITDGNPSYDSAVMAYNAFIQNEEEGLIRKTVNDLKNLGEKSSKYRRFKQMFERLHRRISSTLSQDTASKVTTASLR